MATFYIEFFNVFQWMVKNIINCLMSFFKKMYVFGLDQETRRAALNLLIALSNCGGKAKV
jgi:hypothetical protein